MEELTELQTKLAECRRHSDNHRRSRDYHKEQAADLREEVKELEQLVEFWKSQFEKMDEAHNQERRSSDVWVTVSFIAISFSIAMSVLFFWAVRN
jgi:chromosome segregation ATPase